MPRVKFATAMCAHRAETTVVMNGSSAYGDLCVSRLPRFCLLKAAIRDCEVHSRCRCCRGGVSRAVAPQLVVQDGTDTILCDSAASLIPSYWCHESSSTNLLP